MDKNRKKSFMQSRRQFIASGALVVPGIRTEAKPPNILFLLSDDQRWDTLGCMGNSIIRTPNVDSLSRQGVTFRNTFVTTSICMTSRASFFTGLHERSHGISSFSQPLSPAINANTYPELLRRAGYRIGFIGKWGLGGMLPENRFDYFWGFPGQGKYFHEQDGKTVHLTRIMGEHAIKFLDGCSEKQPFCLSISFKAPHVQDEDPRQFLYDPAYEQLYKDVTIPVPKTAGERYFKRLPEFLQDSEGRRRWEIRFSTPEKYQTSVKGYYRLISGIDVVVGRIRKRLAERGLSDDTVILFAGDNGFFLGEHGLAGKWFMYEESIRVPLIICDPRLPASAQNKKRDEMTLNIDVAPTILHLAGIEIPVSVQGRSLLPLVHGENPEWRKEWFYSHLYQNRRIAKSEGIRTGQWKYIRYIESDPLCEELYDLSKDPLEENNLAARNSKELNALRGRWKTWRESLKNWRVDQRWKDPLSHESSI
jgi:arylsulfatase A-like enzyme